MQNPEPVDPAHNNQEKSVPSGSAKGGGQLAEVLARDLDAGHFAVPMLPDVAAQVLASSVDDNADAQALATLIEQDQALAANILRVVNSPAYRGNVEVVALKQATARLGMERIREIALTVSMQDALDPGNFASLVQLSWRQALVCALWAKEIARFARRNVEVAYLCGLLHNVAMPVIVSWLSTTPNKEQAYGNSASEADVEHLLVEHGLGVAKLLVEQWQLPTEVLTAITHLNQVQQSTESDLSLDLAIIEFAYLLTVSEQLPEPNSVLQMACVQQLNFYPDDLEGLLAHQERINAAGDSQ